MEIDKKVINSNLIVPFIAIICFMLIVIGTTYAYFLGSQTDETNNTLNANLVIPNGCSFNTQTTGSCNLTSASSGVNFTDSVISSDEMIDIYDNNSVAQATCNLNVIVNGSKGCTCNYNISLVQTGSDTYTPSSTAAGFKEYTAQINVTGNNPATVSEKNINNISLPTPGPLSVTTNNQAKYNKYQMTVKWYNTSSSQVSHSGKNYGYQLKAQATDCNGGSLPSICSEYYCKSEVISYGQSYDTGCSDSYPNCVSEYFPASGKTAYFCVTTNVTSQYPTELKCTPYAGTGRIWINNRCYSSYDSSHYKYDTCYPGTSHSGTSSYYWVQAGTVYSNEIPETAPGGIGSIYVVNRYEDLPTCQSGRTDDYGYVCE